jgi:hypothetical protein
MKMIWKERWNARWNGINKEFKESLKVCNDFKTFVFYIKQNNNATTRRKKQQKTSKAKLLLKYKK